jgi:hypothetical protein
MRTLIGMLIVAAAVYGGKPHFAEARRTTSAQSSPSEEQKRPAEEGNEKETAHPCCKYCRKGKACGNYCVKRTYPCYQAAGCACDAH